MTAVRRQAVEAFQIFFHKDDPTSQRLDPITVFLRDLGGRGQIVVEVFGSAWAHFFGSIGGESLREFIAGCDECYLASKLVSTNARRLSRREAEREEKYVQRIVRAVIAWARGDFDRTEEHMAQQDAERYGAGYMVDGKRIDPARVIVVTPPRPAAG